MISEIKVFAPASVANVSCGFDVLGLCLDPIGDLIHVKMTERPGVYIGNIRGYKVPKNPLKNVASVAVNALLKSHPTKNGFIINIEKKVDALRSEKEMKVTKQLFEEAAIIRDKERKLMDKLSKAQQA